MAKVRKSASSQHISCTIGIGRGLSRSDVKQIRIIERKDRRYDSIVYTGYSFLDENGKTIFTAGKDMVHVQEFMNRFPELYQKEAVVYTAVNRKKTEG